MAEIWLEAEAFDRLGGWVIDQQSMAQMGSAYIMAHGLGVPVQDAETRCAVPERGTWTVWVRTRDWTAPWKRGTPAGTFTVKINGVALPEILGTNGEHWDWQKAGTVALEKGVASIALHDLTGFNGRCDALYLTTDSECVPENDLQKLAEFRRRATGAVCEDDPVVYDLVVAGGGIAGICAAVAALRTGSRVALIQDRPVLGGSNSSEVRTWLGGFAHVAPYPNLGNVVAEIGPILGGPGIEGPGHFPPEYFEDTRKVNIFKRHPRDRYKLALNERVVAVERDERDPRRIRAVVSRHIRTGAETRFRAGLFADCTGNATLARLMGAEVMYGREARSVFNESLAPEKGDNLVMGMSVVWHSKKADQPTSFPDIDWGIPFTEEKAYYIREGEWEWETGHYRNQVDETEFIRDYGMMITFANWSYLKNRSKRKAEWANDTLTWMTQIGGRREGYRAVGDYVLTQNDIEDRVVHPDATASLTWKFDLHFPDPENAAKFDLPFRSCAYQRGIRQPYPVPYRCLYARDVKNLFLGGRAISVSHLAFSCARVQRTLGMLGEVVGMAASLCAKENACPRDVYERYLAQLQAMMQRGVPVLPDYHAAKCDAAEAYHFKDLGFLHVSAESGQILEALDPAGAARVAALGIRHRQGKPLS